MPPSFEPLKLLETATAAVMSPRRHTNMARRAMLEEDDSSEDDDGPEFQSPPSQENGETPSPAKETSLEGDVTQSSPAPSPSEIHKIADAEAKTPANKDAPSTATESATKTKKQAKVKSTTATKTRTIAAVTPCAKNGVNPSSEASTSAAAASSGDADAITPAAASVPLKRKARQSLLEQTSETALLIVKKMVQFTEDQVKQYQEESKRGQRHIKILQQQLSEAQQGLTQTLAALEMALQQKRDASRDYKKLAKQFEKCQAADSKKEIERNEALKEIKQHKRKLLLNTETIAQATKKSKTEATKKGKSNSELEYSSDEESESDMKETRLPVDARVYDDEDEDSDWEGGAKAKKRTEQGPSISNSTTRRTSRRPVSHEWACVVCTFLNDSSLMTCDACGTKK